MNIASLRKRELKNEPEKKYIYEWSDPEKGTISGGIPTSARSRTGYYITD